MTIEKRENGKFRVRKMINGKRYILTFDHRPTKAEIQRELDKRQGIICDNTTFKECCENYIEIKGNVLSPSTIRGYKGIIRNMPDILLYKDIKDITQLDVQTEINRYSAKHSAKTTKNYNAFISAVLHLYKPDMALHISLPKTQKKKPYIPTQDDITAILKHEKGTKWYVPFVLMCYGLRRSEVCALTSKDLDGNTLTINKAKVQNENNEWIIKHTTKTDASTRDIYIDDELAELIREIDGEIFKEHPNKLLRRLTKVENELGIEHFSIHKMRHYFASQMNKNGVDSATIQKLGGWETDNIMKTIYTHSMDAEKTAKEVNNILFK